MNKNTIMGGARCVYGFIVFICFVILVCGTIYYYEYDKLNMWLKGTTLTQEDDVLHRNVKEVSNRRNHQGGTNGKKLIKPVAKNSPGKTFLPPHIASQHKSQGYILPYRLYEQQTAATRNLWGLQYFANSVNMKVVEPFVSKNTFNFQPIVEGATNPMRFGDIYDMEFWNNQTTEHGCAELVAWEEFLLNAPKTTILVFTCNGNARSPTGLFKKVDNPNRITGNRQCSGTDFPAQALKFFRDLGFQFVREVCIKFSSSIPMSMEKFSQYMLGTHNSNSVTLIFALWHGIRHTRDNLKAPSFRTDNTVMVGLLPSKTMMRFSKEYIKRFNPSGGKYYGVMVRVERVYKWARKADALTDNDVVQYMVKCATNLTQYLNIHPEWSRTLAIDLGQYGSLCYRRSKNSMKPEETLYDAFFNSVFGNYSLTISEFENTFKKYLNFDNAVVIAQLQRTVAVTSDCLVLVGGSSNFQVGALAMYEKLHPNKEDQCIIKHCYRGVDFHVSLEDEVN
ncbi:uncharacterized protein [Dysidea avara]|uniref:uncharacterized protein n=1 Tax=Dysidea avara TaxID=196820 RepID=UPI003328B93E